MQQFKATWHHGNHGNHGNHGIMESNPAFPPSSQSKSWFHLTKKQSSVSLVHGNKFDVPRWQVKNHSIKVPQWTHATRPNEASKLCPVTGGVCGPPLFCPVAGEGVVTGAGEPPVLKGNRQSNATQTNRHHAFNAQKLEPSVGAGLGFGFGWGFMGFTPWVASKSTRAWFSIDTKIWRYWQSLLEIRLNKIKNWILISHLWFWKRRDRYEAFLFGPCHQVVHDPCFVGIAADNTHGPPIAEKHPKQLCATCHRQVLQLTSPNHNVKTWDKSQHDDMPSVNESALWWATKDLKKFLTKGPMMLMWKRDDRLPLQRKLKSTIISSIFCQFTIRCHVLMWEWPDMLGTKIIINNKIIIFE